MLLEWSLTLSPLSPSLRRYVQEGILKDESRRKLCTMLASLCEVREGEIWEEEEEEEEELRKQMK